MKKSGHYRMPQLGAMPQLGQYAPNMPQLGSDQRTGNVPVMGNFGRTPSALIKARSRGRGRFGADAPVVELSDFRGYKKRANLGDFGMFGDDDGSTDDNSDPSAGSDDGSSTTSVPSPAASPDPLSALLAAGTSAGISVLAAGTTTAVNSIAPVAKPATVVAGMTTQTMLMYGAIAALGAGAIWYFGFRK